MSPPLDIGTVQSHSQEEGEWLSEDKVTSSCGNVRPQDGESGVSKAGGKGIIRDGGVGGFRKRNKQSKETNPGSTWMWVDGPTSWRNVYFDTESMGYSEGGKCE